MQNPARSNPFHVIAAAAGICATVMVGCAPPVMFANAGVSLAEAGSSAFIEGELRYARRITLDHAAEAYTAALERLQFPMIRKTSDPGYVYLAADQQNGEEIQVRLTRNSSVVTSIRIRIGLLGDQAIARLIMEEAEQILKQTSPPAQLDAPPAPGAERDAPTSVRPSPAQPGG